MPNENYIYINEKDALLTYLENLKDTKQNVIALDIEAEMNRHAFGERLCLIQIFDGIKAVIIDPLKIDKEAIRALFEDRTILKVMYDAASDQSLLKNTYNINVKSILDLRPAIELLNYDKKDLHSIIAFELGIPLNHKEKYQRYNWEKRPIDQQAIYYALNDVIHLLKLKDVIIKKIYAQGLFDPFFLKNLQVQNKDYTRQHEDRYKSVKGYNFLTKDEKDIFRKIFDIRGKYAERCNLPAHYIINKDDLINIVKGDRQISEIKLPGRLGADLIQSILQELRVAVSSYPKN